MVGKAYVSVFPFYDNKASKMSFKRRPVLVVGKADSGDYVILPISRITNQSNLDSYYDVPIEPTDVPLLNLVQTSYIRTHKQSVVHEGELAKEIVDFKNEYEEIYLDVLCKMEKFQRELIANAL